MKVRYLIIGFLLIANCVHASVIVVHENGKYTIKETIEQCLNGDTVIIKEGYYPEHSIVVNKRVMIIGENRPVIDGENAGVELFIITADSVHIQGLVLKNVGVSFLKEYAAIKVKQAGYGTIQDNLIEGTFFGIYLEYASHFKVTKNRISGKAVDEVYAGNAIHAWKASNLEISYNEVTSHRDGIYFEFVDNSQIHHNKSHDNLRYGLHFMFSNRDIYTNNEFVSNGAGVAVMFSKKIQMKNNIFLRNWGGASYGLLLKEISDGVISNNQFLQNTIGILAEGVNRLKISNNQFTRNGIAADIKGNCLDSHITGNNFLANTFEIVTNSRHNQNYYNANYWSSYSGYDLDNDGIGDVPYRPINLYAKITHEIPVATIMLHSFFIYLLDIGERIFPQMIPEELIDESPKMNPYTLKL